MPNPSHTPAHRSSTGEASKELPTSHEGNSLAAETHSPTVGRHERHESREAGLVTSSRTERWVAETVAADEPSRDDLLVDKKPLSTWAEAWQRLRRRPLFWVSMVIILAVLLVTFFPGLFYVDGPENGGPE